MNINAAFEAYWLDQQIATHPDGNPSVNWGRAFKPFAKEAFCAAWTMAIQAQSEVNETH